MGGATADLEPASGGGEGSTPAEPPLVSVIVATNRVSPFFEEALQSVRDQTYPRIEVVIVDDGAVDATAISAVVTAAYPDALVIRQDAAGVAIARNIGAAQATGAVLAFLDDDDRWHPQRLERQMASLDEDRMAVAGYCGMQSIDAEGRVIVAADQVPIINPADVARRTAGIMVPNLIVRREAFERVGGFHSSIRLAEDLDLVLKLSLLGGFVFTNEPLVDYRTHSANSTRRHRELCRSIDRVVMLHMWCALERKDEELVAAHRDSLRANGRFAWWGALRSAKTSLREHRPGRAIGDILWALRFAPRGIPDAIGRRLRSISRAR